MRAVAVNPGRRTLDIVDHPAPIFGGPTSVRLHMLDVGICGTDREIASFQYGTPPPGSDYLVIGHESLGQVVEVGSAVEDLHPGDLAVPMVRRPCRHPDCPACRAGRQDFCYSGDFTERGIKQAHGFMTEFVVDEARYMNLVPPAMREVAVLVEPLTIAEKALLQVWKIQSRLPWAFRHAWPEDASFLRADASGAENGAPRSKGGLRHRAVVIGAGPVGLLGAMALQAAGFETYVYSRGAPPDPRSDVVRAIGAVYLDSQTHDVDQLAERVGNIDLVYEAAGASRVAFDVIKVLGTNGIFVFTGVPGRKAPTPVDTDLLMRDLVLKNQVVLGTVNAGRDAFQAAIRDIEVFLQRWPDAVRGLITGRFPMTAVSQLLGPDAPGIKSVVAIDETGA